MYVYYHHPHSTHHTPTLQSCHRHPVVTYEKLLKRIEKRPGPDGGYNDGMVSFVIILEECMLLLSLCYILTACRMSPAHQAVSILVNPARVLLQQAANTLSVIGLLTPARHHGAHASLYLTAACVSPTVVFCHATSVRQIQDLLTSSL